MADKFGRSYILNIQTDSGDTLTIKPPFTVEFDITRNALTSANVCSFRIFNLNANHRGQIRKDINDFGKLRAVQFMAGYGSNLPIVFDGNITQAWSVREGSNFITQIESFDGGFAFANASISNNFPAETTQHAVMESMIADLKKHGVKRGAIGNSYTKKLKRGNAYTGNTINVIKELSGGGFFIDNGKAYALSDDEVIEGPVTVINSESGLLGTPVRERLIINVDMLFEPRLLIAQKIELKSTTEANFNGPYRVMSIKHRGMISESVCGDAVTSVGLRSALNAVVVTP